MMAAINIKTAAKVTPQCYAYTTPGVPAHDGWTKIGFTERDVETRIKEQKLTLFDMLADVSDSSEDEPEAVPCRIFNWRSNTSLKFMDIKEM